jgi:hypothetical protein
MDELLFKPKLCGARFANHAIPLEVLKDFAALEEMLIEVAKREYLEQFPSRHRAPRGFIRGAELRLAAIEEGSAVISLVLASVSVMSVSEIRFLNQAQDRIVRAIESAAHDR